MTRPDYLDALRRALHFLGPDDQADAVSDMTELYDGLASRGMTDEAIQERIGPPEAVAREYRLVASLDRAARSPGVAAGLRAAIASFGGAVARGVVFGIAWIALAFTLLAAAVVALAGTALANATLVSVRPVIATLALPGIPAVTGVLTGLAFLAAGLALLFGARAAMRGLAARMRAAVEERRHADENRTEEDAEGTGSTDAAEDDQAGAAAARTGHKRWTRQSRVRLRLHWLFALAAGVLAATGALLMPVVRAQEFPVVVDQSRQVDLTGARRLEVVATKVDVIVVSGPAARVGLAGRLGETFAQRIELGVTSEDRTVRVTARHQEGLSWGINPWPILTVEIPDEPPVPVEVRAMEAGIDLDALPAAVRDRVSARATPRR